MLWSHCSCLHQLPPFFSYLKNTSFKKNLKYAGNQLWQSAKGVLAGAVVPGSLEYLTRVVGEIVPLFLSETPGAGRDPNCDPPLVP